jgi:hypothetical protein
MTVLNSASNPKQREWSYDVMTDCYRHISGVIVDRMDIDNCGGDLEAALNNALKMSQMSNMASVGAIGAPLQYPNSMYNGIGQMPTNPMIQSGTFTINNPPNANNFVITTDKGVITLNLKTGDITFPLEIGRDEAIRDFWNGFQLYFGVNQDNKFQIRIKELEDECFKLKNDAESKAKQKVLDKITKKYSNEKFIMTKPADLIKLIEEA